MGFSYVLNAEIKERSMGQKKSDEGKEITAMLCVVRKNLEDLPFLAKGGSEDLHDKAFYAADMTGRRKKIDSIDTIVNSASPDLMGSEKTGTIDNLLHNLIDQKLKENNVESTFNQMICSELASGNSHGGTKEEICISRIRCPRGKAVLTGGYGLCDYVIHAVGTRFQPSKVPDWAENYSQRENFQFRKKKTEEICTSSRIQILESCYYEIVRLIRQHPDIRNAAVPIIGSGNYGVDFKIAAKIAVSAIGNALMEWKQSDDESFNTSNIESIVFFVKPEDDNSFAARDSKADKEDQTAVIKEIFKQYKEIYQRNHNVVFQDSFISQRQYYNEILQNDKNRGYFAIAGAFRRALVRSRMFFGFLSNKVKDIVGKNDWQSRRTAVECITAIKLLFPVLGFLLVWYRPGIAETSWIYLVSLCLFYSMADTVTYLLGLLMMADIQKPSANVIRSLLLLFFNYIEVSLEMAYFYYVYGTGITFEKALAFGVLGEGTDQAVMSAVPDMIIGYANAGLKFFFLTVVFGYLVQHMRQRKFRGEN